ncbi:AraC family transcriptional regulator [Paenibacillus hodogayensis]|uniref:AraC family transcriptional regulator n=1 Tax=Paenibacillus hodogayensis TaxID=279208 RepID=A0ABV5W3G1_9BACL
MFYEEVALKRELNFVPKIARLTEHAMHVHDALEVSILLENEAKYRLADRDYYGKPGDVFVFRPFEPHYNLVRDKDKPVRWIMLLFSPAIARHIPEGGMLLRPFYTAAGRFPPLIPADSPCARAIQRAAREAVAEEEHQLSGWQAKQFQCFIDILVQLYRHYAAMELDSHKPDEGVLRVIDYVLSHFGEELTMDRLVDMSSLGRTIFFRRFKEITSLSPNAFISRLRLQAAVYMLDYSGKTVTDIAFECGFQSLSYFNKQFKPFKGMSPREYRSRKREEADPVAAEGDASLPSPRPPES